jgi:pSer/pThr/pTyr-binding forkhead associated (FHA) protein
MAKLFFVGLDGTEKSYRLQTHRPFTVGRDPGNDIILRDPKVSRHHAEIVFERGFFVLHDLASANGTYVNGKRIRVAPLTHGAKLRMGNSFGRFSEELPTENDASGDAARESSHESSYEQSPQQSYEQPSPDDAEVAVMPTAQHERISLDTLPHEKLTEDDVKKN